GHARQDRPDAGAGQPVRASGRPRPSRLRGHVYIDALDDGAEGRIEAVTRVRETDANLAGDAARIGREQEDAVAHQHRLLDVVRDENDAFDRELSLGPEIEEIGA